VYDVRAKLRTRIEIVWYNVVSSLLSPYGYTGESLQENYSTTKSSNTLSEDNSQTAALKRWVYCDIYFLQIQRSISKLYIKSPTWICLTIKRLVKSSFLRPPPIPKTLRTGCVGSWRHRHTHLNTPTYPTTERNTRARAHTRMET